MGRGGEISQRMWARDKTGEAYFVQPRVTSEHAELQALVEQRMAADILRVCAGAGMRPDGGHIAAQQATFPRNSYTGREHIHAARNGHRCLAVPHKRPIPAKDESHNTI